MITKEQALKLEYGQQVLEVGEYNSDGTPKRWRVNGKVKTWKRDLDRFEVPLKHGLRNHGYLTNLNNSQLCLGMFKRECSVCGKHLGWLDAEKEIDSCYGYEVSHGYCQECGVKAMKKIDDYEVKD